LIPNKPIEILHASRLDKARWDHCVQSHQGLIYTYSWYLDAMADDWYGLVAGDYEAILPLPVKKKYGIRMVAMPPFVQRLDLLSTAESSHADIARAILRFSRLIQFSTVTEDLFVTPVRRKRTNYILPLYADYSSIMDKYHSSCRKNLNKANSRGCMPAEKVSINDVIRLYRDAYGEMSGYTGAHFDRLIKLIASLPPETYHLGGVQQSNGTLVYAGLLLDDGKRLYYLLGAPTREGRNIRATYFFLDSMIRRFAGSGRTWDFEGSDIPDVATFYQSFSPDTEYYFQYYSNNFPFPLNKLLDSRLRPF